MAHLAPSVLLRKLGSTCPPSEAWNEITGFYFTKPLLTTGMEVNINRSWGPFP